MSDDETVDTSVDDQQVPYPPDEGFDEEDLDSGVVTPRGHAARQKALSQRLPQVHRAKVKPPGKIAKSGKRILAQQKRRQALELRKAGAPYADIAERLGYYDQSGARKAVAKAFGEIIQEPVTELRTIQVERLNHMLVALWGKVNTGDERAIGTALAIMNKIDALMGTEQAQQVDVNINRQSAILVIDGDKDAYIRALKQMAGAGVQADGTNSGTGHAITAGQTPPGMGSTTVVQGAVVEDAQVPVMVDPVELVMTDPDKYPEPKRFDFSVEPTYTGDEDAR